MLFACAYPNPVSNASHDGLEVTVPNHTAAEDFFFSSIEFRLRKASFE